MAEFALVFTILMMLLFGLFEFGRAFNTYLSVIQGAREGARAAMTSGVTDATITSKATSAASPASVTVSISHSGTQTTVTVSSSFTAIVPMISALWGGGALPITRAFTSQ